jgi:ParB family transcriptional regulator, chromosome partitioning protein
MRENKAEHKKGLGQGLAAILGADLNPAGYETKSAAAQELPIHSIKPNPHQPRKYFRENEIQELAASIAQTGVLQPIIVREMGPNEYEIVAGERRWRAAQQANLTKIPVIIKQLNDTEAFVIALAENIQRADLNPMEEAEGYQVLVDQMHLTQEDIAEMLGKSRSHVANTLRLNMLSRHIRTLVANNDLSSGHAKALMGVENAEGIAELIVKRQLNVRQTERLIRRLKKKDAHTAEDLDKLASAIVSQAEAVSAAPEPQESFENDDPEQHKVRQMISKALPYAQVEFYFQDRKPALKIQFKHLGDLDAFLDKLA